MDISRCDICPRNCRVDRKAGRLGYCRAPYNPVVYSYMAHRGEEPPISGRLGSGTIFFSHCNMKCVYCQNYTFSQLDKGEEISIEKLAEIMLSLQKNGCHNINLVSPTHFVPQIVSALKIASGNGLKIPIVYNTSGYEKVETIKALEGIIDIYLTDMRYSEDSMAAKYSDAPDYVDYNRPAVLEMQRQGRCFSLVRRMEKLPAQDSTETTNEEQCGGPLPTAIFPVHFLAVQVLPSDGKIQPVAFLFSQAVLS